MTMDLQVETVNGKVRAKIERLRFSLIFMFILDVKYRCWSA